VSGSSWERIRLNNPIIAKTEMQDDMKKVEFEVGDIMRPHDNFKKYSHVRSILISGIEKMEDCKFSIVIPTYKRVETLKDTIQSCLCQKSIESYDIIVVDNNPDRHDETERYLLSLNNPKVKYYKNASNIGMTGNWNRCLELCDGEYAILLHDDDMLSPDYLSNVSNVIRKHLEVDVLYVGLSRWYQYRNTPCPLLEDDGKHYPLYKASIINCFLTKNHTPTGMVLKKESVFLLGGFDERCYPSADYYFFSAATINNLNVFNYAKKLIIYRYSRNESLNEETRLSFVTGTVPLQQWLLDKQNVSGLFRKLLLAIMANYGLRVCKSATLRTADLSGIYYSSLLLMKDGPLRRLLAKYYEFLVFIIRKYLYRTSTAIDII
jgi:glycosyltransferase involved in cell wall biosynthesis